MIDISLALLIFLVATAPKAAAAPSRRKPEPRYEEVRREIDRTIITCRKTSRGWIPGSGLGRRFNAYSYQIRDLKLQIRKTTLKTRKRKLSAKLKKLRDLLPLANAICRSAGESPQPTPSPGTTPTPVPTAIPVELSLDALVRPFTEDDLMYLLEKAGYGYNPKRDHYLLDLARSGGVHAVVDNLLSHKGEPAGLEARLFERLDDNLAAGTTRRTNYTLQGMREAAVELAVNTRNPLLVRLGWETFYGKWTVNERALTNQRQYELFWDYRKLLYSFAYNEAATLRDVLVEISKHPMMLWFLDNGSSTAGNPNENYAREIQELYSMGTHRWNDRCEKVQNYFEAFDGIRQYGDIFQATLALTGWLVTDRTIDNERYYRAAFSEADWRPGPKVMYRGTPHERTVYKMEDVVEAILAHPGTAQGLATDLLKAYVTPEPSCQSVLEFSRIISAKGYNLRAALSILLKSNLFYNPRFRNTVIKTPLHRTAQFINALGLTYSDQDLVNRPPEILEGEIGVNVGSMIGSLDAMGMTINSPATVFYYDENAFYSSLGFAEQANVYWNIAADRTRISTLLGTTSGSGDATQYLYYDTWRPAGEQLARTVIEEVARRLRVELSPDAIAQLEYFLNNSRQWNDPSKTYRVVYDNRGSFDKLTRLWVIIASLPGFFTA